MRRTESIGQSVAAEHDILRNAAEMAIARACATHPHHQIRIQESIRWLADSGFARHSDGTLDAGCLADAAVTFGALAAAGSPRRTTAADAHWVV